MNRGVIEGDGHVVREQPYELQVLGVEVAPDAIQVERPDDAVGVADRRHDHRLVFVRRGPGHVDDSGIVLSVVDDLGLALDNHVPGDPRAKRRPAGEDLLRVLVARQDWDEAALSASTR